MIGENGVKKRGNIFLKKNWSEISHFFKVEEKFTLFDISLNGQWKKKWGEIYRKVAENFFT